MMIPLTSPKAKQMLRWGLKEKQDDESMDNSRIIMRGLIITIKTLSLITSSPIQPSFVTIPTSSTLLIASISSVNVSLSIHIMGTFWGCNQMDTWVNDCFDTSPILFGSENKMTALAKCHGSLVSVLFLLVSAPNLRMNTLFP